jgi:hypothetical protein
MADTNNLEKYLRELDEKNTGNIEFLVREPSGEKSSSNLQTEIKEIPVTNESEIKSHRVSVSNISDNPEHNPQSRMSMIITGATILAIIITLMVFFANSSADNKMESKVYVIQTPANIPETETEKTGKTVDFHGVPALVYSPTPIPPEVLRERLEPPPPPESLIEYNRKVEEKIQSEGFRGIEG